MWESMGNFLYIQSARVWTWICILKLDACTTFQHISQLHSVPTKVLGDKNVKSFSRTALQWRILKIDMGVLHACSEQSNSLSTCSRPTESSNQKISFWADWLMGFPSNVLAMSKLVLAFLKVRDVESTFGNCMECNLELADFSWSISWKA